MRERELGVRRRGYNVSKSSASWAPSYLGRHVTQVQLGGRNLHIPATGLVTDIVKRAHLRRWYAT